MELGNTSAEHDLLSCILLDNTILDQIADDIKVDSFFSQINRVIYGEMLKMAKEHKPIDTITLFDAIKLIGKENDIGLGYVMNLRVATSANYQSYVDIVKREATRRDILLAARQIDRLAKEGVNADDMLEQSQQLLQKIDIGASKNEAEQAGSITANVIDELFANSEKDCTGLRTGFSDLDKLLDGLHESELIIIAARPAMGKTAFALNIAMNAAKDHKVLLFSLEMSKNELVKRLMSMQTGLSSETIKHPTRLSNEFQQRIWDFADEINKCKLVISDTADQSIAAIKATTRIVKNKLKGLDLIIIDYLTLIKATKANSREQEVAEISRFLKMLAKEYRVPVVALAQVNRNAEGRSEKKPALADLRESGAIEQDADVVMFLYREEYYNPATERQHTCDVIIAKHRNGAVGDIQLYFNASTTKFGNMDKRYT